MSMMIIRKKSAASARGAKAFTLIELLVVVSIIALLISILLPSLKKARDQARITTCVANLKGVSTASLVYAADDSHEQAVPVQWTQFVVGSTNPGRTTRVGAMAWGGKAGRGRVDGDPMFWGTKNHRGPAERPLNIFIYKDGFVDHFSNPGPGLKNWKSDENLNLGMFRCPADIGWTGGMHIQDWIDQSLTSYDHYGNSYDANALWISSSADTTMWSNSAYLRPVSRIPNPANTVYYEENCARYSHWHLPQPSGCPTLDEDEENKVNHGWHGRDWAFVVGFCDAHAGMVRMKGAVAPRLPEYPQCTQPDQQACYNYWHCVITRGDGWQKDTLPSPAVPTTVPVPSG
jgi:prepilin-type N-terminal cleavage/methylation domain-containing protein